jgi:hypothetical protein
LKRLGDPEDSLTYSVRHITVGYTSTTARLPESSLILALRNIRLLETFTWSTCLPITSPILNCLQEAHPSAHLVAIAIERNDLPLDELLLSSPQLHTLDIKLSALYDKNFKKPMGKSEAQHVKSILVRSSGLKVLKLRLEKIKHGSKAARNRFQGYGPSELDPISFRFKAQEMMPALEELTLRGVFHWDIDWDNTLAWRRESKVCAEWRAHQDWGALRRLDLRLDGSDHMLQALVGVVPHLQTLKIKTVSASINTLCRFLEKLSRLEHLHIECFKGLDLGSELFYALCSTLPPQLITLYMDIDFLLYRPERFIDLLTYLPHIQALVLESWTHQIFGAWPSSPTPLSPSHKIHSLVRRTKELPPPPRFATGPLRYGYYTGCTNHGFMYEFEIPTPPKWMGYSKDEVKEETKEVFKVFKDWESFKSDWQVIRNYSGL